MPEEMFSGLMSSRYDVSLDLDVLTGREMGTLVSVVFQYWLPTAHQLSLIRCQMNMAGLYAKPSPLLIAAMTLPWLLRRANMRDGATVRWPC